MKDESDLRYERMTFKLHHMPANQPDVSPDHAERIEDFLSRHGGKGNRDARAEETAPDVQGWSEVYAADGYTLRCEWSRFGSHEDMKYSEIAPTAH